MPRALVGIGSNLGDRQALVTSASELIRHQHQVRSVALSSFRQTSPVGGPAGQQPFVNAAVSFETDLSAQELWAVLASIERQLGRKRDVRWGARTIDLDLLLYGSQVIDTRSLVVPHPRMAVRRFVLEPAAEVAGDMVHPLIGWTVRQLLAHLDTAANYVAFAGLRSHGKTLLAEQLARHFEGRLIADPAAKSSILGGGDPPSHEFQRQIEFLDARAAVLATDEWQDDGALVVSDFYFGQGLAYARLTLDAEQYREFVEQWRARRQSVVAPKLVVFLDDAAGAPLSEQDRALAEELRRLSVRQNVGPCLVVDHADPEAALSEIAAAVEAMR
jgi:2-amino-4-hydroxy-6-hydroxymethyldihydropteridine diphosphokinase